MSNQRTDTREKWRQSEHFVAQRYRQQGRRVCCQNFTIRGGELDLVVEREEYRVIVEVKDVSSRDDLLDFIPLHKLQALQRTIEHYAHRYPTTKQTMLDVVFVEHNKILAHYANVTFYE